MAYPDVVRNLVETLEQVQGVASVLAYEPTAIVATPAFYLLLDRAERISKGGVSGYTYSILCRLCFNWVDNEQAELEVMQFLNRVAVAIESSGQVQTESSHGLMALNRVEGVFVIIGGVLYRALDFYVEVTEKGMRRGEV